jgi:hypothetical protein
MVIDLLLEKIYIFIFSALFSLALRILIVYLGEETNGKLKYRNKILLEK